MSSPSPDPRRVIIKNVDMSQELQHSAVEISITALDESTVERDVAGYIKKEFDRLYGTTWHCVVGKSFGSFVTHESKHFIYFYVGSMAILLWKTS